ncbi:MAG: hypothetical protein L3J21_09835 [Devosiaceae bacterium]|nr:hypothetical protein [Devosiaceae bacterium]
MYTIVLSPYGEQTEIILCIDGEAVERFYKKTPVEVAFQVRVLVEEFM